MTVVTPDLTATLSAVQAYLERRHLRVEEVKPLPNLPHAASRRPAMKRVYVILLLVIAPLALAGLAIAEHAGYVLIAYNSFVMNRACGQRWCWWRHLAGAVGRAADRVGDDLRWCGQSLVAA